MIYISALSRAASCAMQSVAIQFADNAWCYYERLSKAQLLTNIAARQVIKGLQDQMALIEKSTHAFYIVRLAERSPYPIHDPKEGYQKALTAFMGNMHETDIETINNMSVPKVIPYLTQLEIVIRETQYADIDLPPIPEAPFEQTSFSASVGYTVVFSATDAIADMCVDNKPENVKKKELLKWGMAAVCCGAASGCATLAGVTAPFTVTTGLLAYGVKRVTASVWELAVQKFKIIKNEGEA